MRKTTSYHIKRILLFTREWLDLETLCSAFDSPWYGTRKRQRVSRHINQATLNPVVVRAFEEWLRMWVDST